MPSGKPMKIDLQPLRMVQALPSTDRIVRAVSRRRQGARRLQGAQGEH
jgi:hypothetical protein